ncbi:MAG: GNAT family N-acetyltransferase [Pseudomonadota bacterium]
MQTEIFTDRLCLRPIRPEDAGPLELYCADERLSRNLERVPHPYPPGMAANFVARTAKDTADDLVRVIEHGSGREAQLIGVIALRDRVRLGFWLGVPFWDAGFATEAVGAFADLAEAEGYGPLEARVFQDNPRSSRVLTKLGFDYLGEGRAFSLARGHEVPYWEFQRKKAST